MQRIDTTTELFSDGDPINNIKGTRVKAAWLNALQEELAAAIEIFGETLDPEDNNQLSKLLAAYANQPGDFIFLPYAPSAQQMLDRRILEGNGGSVLDADYPEILTAWGGKKYGNVDSTHFNLPDLRGYFPRFWNHGASVDPDAVSRTNRGDGITGDQVGTKQSDQYKLHTHLIYTYSSEAGASSGIYTNLVSGTVFNVTTSGAGGNETRPKNIYIWGGIFY